MLPFSLLALLLASACVSVFVHADSYGITVDEPLQDAYGRSVLAWYQTLGHDQRFMYEAKGSHMPEHGAIFEVIVALAQQTFGHPWHTRAVVTGLAGVVGVLAMALCGYELGGWWAALLAAWGLWLYPRFFGAIFNNSKDIPFTSATALVMWAMLLLVRQWEMNVGYLIRNSVLVGFLIGFAIAIRITALFWYPVLLLLLVGWWICDGWRAWQECRIVKNLAKQACAILLIVAVSCVTIMALWPYIALNPWHNFYHSYLINSQYPFRGAVLFAGHWYPDGRVPQSYVPIWLVIGSPPAVVILAAIGSLGLCLKLLKGKAIQRSMVVIALALLFPCGLLIALHPTFYDGMRQFLFLVPALILLAIDGLISLTRSLAHKKQTLAVIGLVLVVLAAQVQVIKDMQALYPYEYMYFSPFIGGVPGASRLYEMDYWGVCNKPAAQWLAQNYRQYTPRPFPTVMGSYRDQQVTPYLPDVFKIDHRHPDFYFSVTRFGLENHFPSYKIIHTEGLQGYVACVIKLKPPSVARSSQQHTLHLTKM